MNSRLYFGKVMHQRMMPMSYRFVYRVFSLLVDIDTIAQESRQLRWLGFNRFNLLSLHVADHGARDGSAWRPWIEAFLSRAGITDVGRVQLLCFPRVLGYTFNPLSVWYCYNRGGDPVAVVCEVSNTFGEHYHYLLHNGGEAMSWPVSSEADKRFYVSPFIDMKQRYHFRLAAPDEKLSLLINEYQHGSLHLVASQTGDSRALNDRNLLRAFFMLPLQPFKVMAMIHWHALKIWLGGGKYHPHHSSTDREKYSQWPVKPPK